MKFLQGISEEIFRVKYMINGEKSPEQVFEDIATEIASVENPKIRAEVRQKFYDILNSGKFIPGGRIMANARPYVNPKSKNYNNCFTIDIEDSMEGIYGALHEDAMISRMGGGVGFDVSKLRPEGSITSNGGEASGPVSFLKVFDASAKTIASGGHRRAAHIALIDDSHPDVVKFVLAKQGDKNKALTQFNISVRLTDKFMKAVEEDGDWHFEHKGKVYPVNDPATGTPITKARQLMDLISKNAFTHNEPGAFFKDSIERDNNGWWAFEMDRCNPCGEIPMPAYSLCCLGALNLTAFITGEPFTPDAKFDWVSFEDTIRTSVRFLDNVLDATLYPLQKIEEFSKGWRRVGLGFTGLADAFAMMGIVYGSKESKELSLLLGKALRDGSYSASVALAREKGMAPNLKSMFGVDRRLMDSDFIKTLPGELKRDIQRFGLRNIALNTTAPTGTISLTIGNNCSSGIEPIFSLSYTRNVRTGKGDETKPEIVSDYAWLLYQDKARKDLQLGEKEVVPKPAFFVTTFDVDPYDAIDVQAAFQKYIDHAISKTANLPNGYTFEQYKDLFMYAYKQGLKGFTSFNPEGSMKGVLEAPVVKKDEPKADSYIPRNEAPKRPESLPCDIFHIHADKKEFLVLAGTLNGSLYEIFVDEKGSHDLKDAKVGWITKKGKSDYSLRCDNGETIENLGKDFNGTYGILARMVSMSLRHGVPLPFVMQQLQKSKEFLGFEKAVSRVLKHYVKEGEHLEIKEKCPSCGNTSLIFQDGCKTCKDCGYSGCA